MSTNRIVTAAATRGSRVPALVERVKTLAAWKGVTASQLALA